MSTDRGMTPGGSRLTSVGGTYTYEPRPCDGCGTDHRHLSDMSDGRQLCITCWMKARRDA
jgi:hypothetical protein